MPILREYDDSSAATTLRIELSSEEGKIAIYSNLSGTDIDINHYDGNDYDTAYTDSSGAVVLNASRSQALIQGPGVFEIVKPINIPMAVYVGSETLAKVLSE